MGVNTTPRFAEIQRLQTTSGLTSNNSLHDLRIAYYGGKVSQNDAVRAYLQSQLGNTTTQSLSDLWRLFFIFKGVTNQSSLGDMADTFFNTIGFGSSIGNALIFNGTSTGVQIPDNALLHVTDFTITMWVKLNALHQNLSTQKELVKRDGPIIIDFNSNGHIEFALQTGGGYASTFSTTASFAAGWYFLGFTFNATTKFYQIYVNGVTDGAGGTLGAALSASTAALNIGYEGGAGNYFVGDIQEFQLYNISTINIANLYNGGVGRKGQSSDANLVCGYHLNSGTTTTPDYGPNGLTANLTGTIAYEAGKI